MRRKDKKWWYITGCALFILITSAIILQLYLRQSNLRHPKIIILAVDGATWDVIFPLIEMGHLPNFKKIIQDGTHGPLNTIIPTLSPIIWTSIATGKSPLKHGIKTFLWKPKDSYHGYIPGRPQRRAKTIWEILNDKMGWEVAVLNWLVTWPAEEEKVKGIVISNIGFGNIDDPSYFYPKKIFDLVHQKIKYSQDNGSIFESIGEEIMYKFIPDLYTIYFPDIDWIQHKHYSKINFKKKIVPDVITNKYKRIDKFLGILFKYIGRNTRLFIVSDHGFETYKNVTVQEFNYMVNRINKIAGEIMDINSYKISYEEGYIVVYTLDMDLLLNDLGLCNTQKMSECEIYSFSPYLPCCSVLKHLFLNIKGREPNGFIPQKNKKLEIRRIGDILSGIVTLKYKKPLLKPIIFPDGEGEPDMRLFVNPDIKEDEEIIVKKNTFKVSRYLKKLTFSGHHIFAPPGILAIYGKNIKGGVGIKNAHIYDVVPTILAMIGLPVGKDMDGKVLTDIFAKIPEIKYIETYEEEREYRERSKFPKVESYEMMMEKLRSLGYIQ